MDLLLSITVSLPTSKRPICFGSTLYFSRSELTTVKLKIPKYWRSSPARVTRHNLINWDNIFHFCTKSHAILSMSNCVFPFACTIVGLQGFLFYMLNPNHKIEKPKQIRSCMLQRQAINESETPFSLWN